MNRTDIKGSNKGKLFISSFGNEENKGKTNRKKESRKEVCKYNKFVKSTNRSEETEQETKDRGMKSRTKKQN